MRGATTCTVPKQATRVLLSRAGLALSRPGSTMQCPFSCLTTMLPTCNHFFRSGCSRVRLFFLRTHRHVYRSVQTLFELFACTSTCLYESLACVLCGLAT